MISKAIIPVAGWGTRRLPITKAIEKCMLPVGNRPLVDYVVQDCIAAGITDIYFVVGEESTQLQQYYGQNKALETYLEANGKEAQLSLIAPPQAVSFTYITQPAEGKYGTAIPISLAAPYIEQDESVVVLMGDDFIYNSDGRSEVARLVQATPKGGCGILGVEVPNEKVGMYGVIESTSENKYVRIVERPRPEEAPSNLINVSKYVLNHAVLSEIINYVETEVGGEYYIIEPINRYVAQGGEVSVVRPRGRYLDGGSVEGWLTANRVVLEAEREN